MPLFIKKQPNEDHHNNLLYLNLKIDDAIYRIRSEPVVFSSFNIKLLKSLLVQQFDVLDSKVQPIPGFGDHYSELRNHVVNQIEHVNSIKENSEDLYILDFIDKVNELQHEKHAVIEKLRLQR